MSSIFRLRLFQLLQIVSLVRHQWLQSERPLYIGPRLIMFGGATLTLHLKAIMLEICSNLNVKEFVDGYALLREMEFSSTSVTEALVMHDNDKDKALAYFLSGSS
ncbi:hypothetical protein L195_g051750, partial [Trifolium pratense]